MECSLKTIQLGLLGRSESDVRSQRTFRDLDTVFRCDDEGVTVTIAPWQPTYLLLTAMTRCCTDAAAAVEFNFPPSRSASGRTSVTTAQLIRKGRYFAGPSTAA